MKKKRFSHTAWPLAWSLWIPVSPIIVPGEDKVRCCWTFKLKFNPLLGSTKGSLFSICSAPRCQDKHTAAWRPSTSVDTTGARQSTPRQLSQRSLSGDSHSVHSVPHFLSLPRLGVFFLFYLFFPPGISFLNGNSPSCLPVVAGKGR